MPEPRRSRVRALFDQAADLPAQQRAALLDVACRDEPDLRAEVEELLALDSHFGLKTDEDGFLQSPLVRSPEQALSLAGRETHHHWIGKTLGRYQITGVLGHGGMGLVLKARDPLIERDVAIKLLAEHRAADATAIHRFLAEAKAVGKLNHRHVATIYEVCQEGPMVYLVMEYIPGGSLSDRLQQQGAMTVLAATQALSGACEGVAAAHAAGLIHRDLKPSNLILAGDGSVKVTDFGLAKVAAETTAQQITQTGAVLGTPYFMSPEQCESRPLDSRSDIYSLGATYYTLLSGISPYADAGSLLQVMIKQCSGPIPDPRSNNPAIPQMCSQIVARSMAKEAADRYPSAEAMLADLLAALVTLDGNALIAQEGSDGTQATTATPLPATPGDVSQAGRAHGSGRFVRSSTVRRRSLTSALMVLVLAGSVAGYLDFRHRAGGFLGSEVRPIRVGVLHSQTGTMGSSESAAIDATLLAIEEINANGGLLGRSIEPVVVDSMSDWRTYALEAERLITDEKVCTIFGCWTSASRKAVGPIVEKYDHLLIYPMQYEGLEQSRNIIYTGAVPNQQVTPALRWCFAHLGKRFFIVGSDYLWPRATSEVIRDAVAEWGGEIVGEAYLPMESGEPEEVVNEIGRTKPDVILEMVAGDGKVAYYRALRRAGLTSDKVPSMSFSSPQPGLTARESTGDYAAWNYFESIDSPANRGFVARFRARFGPQRLLSDPMEASYLGVHLWARAVEAAGRDEAGAIRRALRDRRFQAPEGEVRVDPETQHCFKTPRIGQIQADGRFKIVWSAPHPVQPDPYPSSRTAAEWQAYLHGLYTGWGNQWAAPEGQTPKTASGL